ncbi:MAG: hypothetical protein R3199_04330, partial [Gemmatimonadota bacterium]|nr:hypothetical protein [Gemmatimonadota bacterium]
SIFFNNGEAQWLAELFLPGRAEVDSTRAAGWSGGYAFRSVENTLAQDPDGRVRAVPGDTIAGRLTLHERDGLLRGTLTIGSRSMAVSAAGDVDGSLQLLAVSRGWRKVWLTRTAGGYEGRWVSAGLPSGRLRVEGRLLDVRRVAPRGGD